jgi:hypothetical protein
VAGDFIGAFKANEKEAMKVIAVFDLAGIDS